VSQAPKIEKPQAAAESPKDASRKDIVLYSLANVENAFCNLFPNALQQVLIIVFMINPLLTGLVLSLKVLIDAVTDPIMAYISDNAKTRFGRRRPFIFVGATGRMLVVVLLFLLFPQVDTMLSNAQLAEKDAAESSRRAQIGQTVEVETGTVITDPATTDHLPDHPAESEIAKTPAPVVEESAPGNLLEPLYKPLVDGVRAFFSPENASDRSVVGYVLVMLVLFTLFSTVVATPYYAMGIELCSTYEGRTRLVVYRSVIDKAIGFLNPWIIPFIFSTIWVSAIQGFLVVAIIFAVAGIGTTWLMVFKVKEPQRAPVKIAQRNELKLGFFRSLWITMRNRDFLRVFLLYQIIGVGNGIFIQFNFFLNVYWVASSAAKGSTLFALAGTMGWLMALLSLPVMKYIADRFEKHRAVGFGVVMMTVGSIANWWLLTPENPYLQLISPLFFAFGITGFYSIMGAILADVTDVDELETGQRREGMFSAIMALLGKMVGTVTPVLAAIILMVSGFDATLGFEQQPGTFTTMRILYCFGPIVFYLFAIWIAFSFPLNRARMLEIQAELERRRQAVT